ncbi:MAG TPA: hypothetical protein VGD79_06415 [Thermoanaerobaculia bacterium]
MAADLPAHTLCIVEDVPSTTDIAVISEWRSEVAEFRKLLEQVKHVPAASHPDYTFRQFEVTRKGSGDWLSLTHRAWYQLGDASASQVRPPSKCDWCPLSHVRRLFRETVQSKLFDAEQGLYRPYPVTQCEREDPGKVAITVLPANELRLEPDVLYVVGEWMQRPGKPRRLVMSTISLEVAKPADDRLHATFEVQAPTEKTSRGFRYNDCTGVPPHPIVLVPRLVMPLAMGTHNTKVR